MEDGRQRWYIREKQHQWRLASTLFHGLFERHCIRRDIGTGPEARAPKAYGALGRRVDSVLLVDPTVPHCEHFHTGEQQETSREGKAFCTHWNAYSHCHYIIAWLGFATRAFSYSWARKGSVQMRVLLFCTY